MVHILLAPIIAIALLGSADVASAATNHGAVGVATETVDSTIPDGPPTTANEFFPENADLTDCLGTVERPGCGSKARGGWRQGLVFVAMFIGLSIIFGRVAVGLNRSRKNLGQGPTLRE